MSWMRARGASLNLMDYTNVAVFITEEVETLYVYFYLLRRLEAVSLT